MSRPRIAVRHKVAIGVAALTAAVALPLQVGVAHAATPEDDLSACVASAIANMGASTDAFDASVNDCVAAFLQELGVDPSQATTTTVDATPTDGSVNTGILGTVDAATATS